MSGKKARKQRGEEARKSAIQSGVPCLVRRDGDGVLNPCKVHQGTPKITEQNIRDITHTIGLLRVAAFKAVHTAQSNSLAIRDSQSDACAALQRHITVVGESAKQIDSVNCTVLRELDDTAPWAGIKGIRDFLSHGIDPDKIDTRLLIKRVESYLPFLVRMPAFICYAQPTDIKRANSVVTDMELVQALHKKMGGIVRLKYLRFLWSGECYSYVFASGLPGKTVGLYNKDTGEEIPDAVLGGLIASSDIAHHTISERGGDGGEDDIASITQKMAVLRQTPPSTLNGNPP